MIRNIGFKKFTPAHQQAGDNSATTLLDLHLAKLKPHVEGQKYKVHIIFGTRPELIKLAPVIKQFRANPLFETKVVNTGQHVELLENLFHALQVEVDYQCDLLKKGQPLASLYAKAIEQLNSIIVKDTPDVIVVQGDTTSAAAGALAGFLNVIPVAHVEAGLRTFNLLSPFPEELNRILIGQVATLHFAPTRKSVDNLLRAGFPPSEIFHVGNTIIDSLHQMLANAPAFTSPKLTEFFAASPAKKKVLLTLHRRENQQDERLGHIMSVLVELAREHEGKVDILYPVHFTPAIKEQAALRFINSPNVKLCDPIDYFEFVNVLKNVDFIVSDSGGIQEEALALLKPILILRDNTERGEVVEAGIGHLVGSNLDLLKTKFGEFATGTAQNEFTKVLDSKPYGIGQSSKQIVDTVGKFLQGQIASNSYDLSIVVPCYNEEGNIATIMERLVESTRSEGLNAELIFVDDYSVDKTYSLGCEHAWHYPNVRMLTKTFPRGMGNAIRFGLNHATADIAIITMADGSDDLTVLGKLYRKIRDEGCDLAIASRYRDRRNAENIPFIYRFFSALFRFLASRVVGIPLTDFTNAYRAFNWKALKQIGLEGTGFEISPEITFKAWYLRKAVAEVDARHLKRSHGQSKFSFLKAGPGYGKMMIKAFIARFTKSWPYIDW